MKLNHLCYEKRVGILEAIANGGVTASDIMRSINVTHMHVTHMLTQFEKLGVLNRYVVWGRRGINIQLTKRGSEVLRELEVIRELIKK